MKSKKKVNVAASIRQRLLNLAQSKEQDYVLVLRRYAIERLLYRLSQSAHKDRFVLKGAMLFVAWGGEFSRPTKDLDLLGFGENTPEALKEVFQSLCRADNSLIDGLLFDQASVRVEPIRDDQLYNGIRLTFEATLEHARIPLQVDVGFGDSITPAPQMVEYPTLLDAPKPMLSAYPPETVIAEKLEALVTLDFINSRMKDFFDLWTLSNTREFDGRVLIESVKATFARRGVSLPPDIPTGLTPAFYGDELKVTQWNAFLRKNRLQTVPANFVALGEKLREFLVPILEATKDSRTLRKRWRPSTGWSTTNRPSGAYKISD